MRCSSSSTQARSSEKSKSVWSTTGPPSRKSALSPSRSLFKVARTRTTCPTSAPSTPLRTPPSSQSTPLYLPKTCRSTKATPPSTQT
jgi:hypothetical protein